MAQPAEGVKALQIVQYARQGESLDLSYFVDNSDKYNNLVPFKTVQPLSPYHLVGISIVKLNPDPDAGDVYKDSGTGQLRPAKVGLMKLSSGAGIQWVMDQCRLLYLTDHRCGYQAVGFIIGPDGMPKPIKGTKDIDLLALEDEIRMQQERKLEKGIEDWSGPAGARTKKLIPWENEAEYKAAVDQAVRKEMVGKRKNLVQLAETGAYLRAIRSALALKSNYTPAELARPFVMTRTFVDPQADPEMVKEAIRASFHMTVELPRVAAPMARGLLEPPTMDMGAVPEGPDDDTDPGESEAAVEGDDADIEAEMIETVSEEISEGELDSGIVMPSGTVAKLQALRSVFPAAEVSWNGDAKRREGPESDAWKTLTKLVGLTADQARAVYALLHFAATGELLELSEADRACSGRVFNAINNAKISPAQIEALREDADWLLSQKKAA